MSVSHHSLQRSLQRLSLGTIRDLQKKQAQRDAVGMQEAHLQFQIPLLGTAVQGIAWKSKAIAFDFVFWPAVGQREDADFSRPQFSSGVVMESVDKLAAPSPVIITPVIEWTVGKAGQTVGCVVHIGIHSPTADALKFSGYLHLTFQGYGAPLDDPSTY